MARIWHEGFEDGLPYNGYLEGSPESQYASGIAMPRFPITVRLASGRNALSLKAMQVTSGYFNNAVTKTLPSNYSEGYVRVYFKITSFVSNAYWTLSELFGLLNSSGQRMLSIFQVLDYPNVNKFCIKSFKSSSYAERVRFTLSLNTWYKLDMYFKVNGSTGAYTVKLDDTIIYSETGLNTGTTNVDKIFWGFYAEQATYMDGGGGIVLFDDIAFNDTVGSLNNSWCGSGTILSIKPKGAGNKSQWDTCTGYAKGESGTNTTNIKITGHGLSTNDVIYNKTRDAYRIVTYVDADNFTVTSVTGQTTNDVILLYKNVATITAGSGTDNTRSTLAAHTMQSGDVIVNTTRSNAIRKVIYVNGNYVYTYVNDATGWIGESTSSQASGDTIKTFAFTPYAMSNHYEAVANVLDPSPKKSYIESTTSGDIDTFDMEELVADKGLPSSSTIVAISHNVYAQEAGAGSQIKPVFRIGSTDYEGSAIPLGTGTLQYQTIYETSPATAVAFTISEVDGLEAGVKLV
jgi:hypothetical protein